MACAPVTATQPRSERARAHVVITCSLWPPQAADTFLAQLSAAKTRRKQAHGNVGV